MSDQNKWDDCTLPPKTRAAHSKEHLSWVPNAPTVTSMKNRTPATLPSTVERKRPGEWILGRLSIDAARKGYLATVRIHLDNSILINDKSL